MIPSFLQAGRPRRPRRRLERLPRGDRAARWTSIAERAVPGDEAGRAARRRCTLVDFDPDGEDKLVAAMLYPHTDLPERQVARTGRARCRPTSGSRVVRAYVGDRTNRRHKPGRALERIDYRFDVLRRLRRVPRPAAPPHADHRVAAAHARATATRGPRRSTPAGAADAFDAAMERSAALYDALVDAVPGAGALRGVAWPTGCASRCRCNAREAMHLIELRTGPQGHPAYRRGRARRCTA